MLYPDKGIKSRLRDGMVLFLTLALVSICIASILADAQISDSDAEIYFFFDKSCPHCAEEKEYLHKLGEKYPQLKINYYDSAENRELFEEFCERYDTIAVGVPRTFIGNTVFVGFNTEDCDLVWYQGYNAYVGCPNQIENAVRQLMNFSTVISKADALETARKNCLVCNLTSSHKDVIANVVLTDDVYLVAWWTPERIKSDINYPNILVKLDAKTGDVISAEEPTSKIEGLVKPPLHEPNYLVIAVAVLLVLVPVAYMVFGACVQRRYWISLYLLVIIALVFTYFESLPSMNIVAYAKQFSFPVFTFIIALVDGFNPCAFAVLAFLLSILTHTRSRKKMLFIGSIFILTSGFMYFLFIIVLLFLRTELLGEYKEIIRYLVAVIAMVAGIINIKDFFFFKKGVSLTMSAEKQGKIFKRIGALVREVNNARSKRDLLFAAVATMALAAMVNLVELGCTFILPMEYIETMLVNYPNNPLSYIILTAFYAAVYVIPLFAILGSFVYSFKSERLNETQGRILKLVGGIIMLSLGLILIFKPELLMFGG
ncbi:MAG: hypothetical protein JW778_00125 [Candidatus Altiarchaeota archaeon]|nr:hypothetical protein [Candidatus Altiarchaeota archaeon]